MKEGRVRMQKFLMPLAALFSVLTLGLQMADAAAVPPRDARAEAVALGRFWNDVLALRVDRILEGRRQALAQVRGCESLADELALERRGARDRGLGSGAVDAAVPVALMGAWQRMQAQIGIDSACGRAMAGADLEIHRAERAKFAWAREVSPALPREIRLAIAELDPWCAVGAAADFGRTRDGNPCFAGDLPVLFSLLNEGRTGRGNAASFDAFSRAGAEIDEWLARFTAEVASLPRGGRIDLLALAPQRLLESESSRRRLLAEITYLYAAAGFEIGWIDGFGERFWSGPLRAGASPARAYASAMTWMNRKQLFSGWRNFARSRGVRFHWGAREVTDWNHHDFISAFMGCDLQERGQAGLGRALPEALGIAYESLDFVSHMKEGDGFEASAANFRRDVGRHVEGAAFGEAFCRPDGRNAEMD